MPRERRVEGLVMFLSVAVNMTLANLQTVMRGGAIQRRAELALAESLFKRLRIKMSGADGLCLNLSGGTSRRWGSPAG